MKRSQKFGLALFAFCWGLIAGVIIDKHQLWPERLWTPAVTSAELTIQQNGYPPVMGLDPADCLKGDRVLDVFSDEWGRCAIITMAQCGRENYGWRLSGSGWLTPGGGGGMGPYSHIPAFGTADKVTYCVQDTDHVFTVITIGE